MSGRNGMRPGEAREGRAEGRHPKGTRLAAGAGLSLAALLAVPAVADADPIQVTRTDDRNFSCGDEDTCSLREAIFLANQTVAHDTITFAANVTGDIALVNGQLLITQPLDIDGPGATTLTIDAQEDSRIFDVDDADVTISGLTLTGGSAAGDHPDNHGGAIRSHEGTNDLTVRDAIITGNAAAGRGGGIYASRNGSVTIENTTFTGNEADTHGGGVYLRGGIPDPDPVTVITIAGSTFTGNSSYNGAGIDLFEVAADIERSTVSGNVGEDNGGGVYALDSTVSILNSTLSGNSLTDAYSGGGGIHTQFSDTLISNSTLSENSAMRRGGAMYSRYGSLAIESSTITANSAGAYGGGVHAENSATQTIANTIVAGNAAPEGPDLLDDTFPADEAFDASFSLIGDATDAVINETVEDSNIVGGDGAPLVDPLLGGLALNGGPTMTHRPARTSPVVDKGFSDGLDVDQRGFARPVDVPFIANSLALGADASDIGAVELTLAEASPPVVATPPNVGAFRRCVRRANRVRRRAVRRANRIVRRARGAEAKRAARKRARRIKRRATNRRKRAVRRCRARFL